VVLQKILRWRKQKQIMLVGTSGDTGSAAIEAVRQIPEIGIAVLYPSRAHSNVSAAQEAQICRRVGEARVRVVRVEGGSDDLDVPIDALFHDPAFRAAHRLGSLNSVNVVRMLMQLVHIFYSYLQAEPAANRPAVVAIPTGAGGHITAGVLAVQMGLPVARLLAATNDNDLLTRFLATGCAKRGAVVGTTSPAMDVQVPYNIERLLHSAPRGRLDVGLLRHGAAAGGLWHAGRAAVAAPGVGVLRLRRRPRGGGRASGRLGWLRGGPAHRGRPRSAAELRGSRRAQWAGALHGVRPSVQVSRLSADAVAARGCPRHGAPRRGGPPGTGGLRSWQGAQRDGGVRESHPILLDGPAAPDCRGAQRQFVMKRKGERIIRKLNRFIIM